jgi:glutamine---fructose-6-phosphate transaminase (isomerizing)
MPRAATQPLPGAPEPWAASTVPAFRSRPPYLMTEMIAAEPALADRLLRRLASDPELDLLADAVRAATRAGRPILVTGCGTSEHAAMAIATLMDDALTTASGAQVRTEQALETLRRPLREGLVLAVSHEGGTHATNEALRAARDGGATTALVTVGRGSPGAALADIVIATGEQDASWCHTVGYLSPILAGVALAARLGGTRVDGAAVRALLDVTDDAHQPSAMAAALSGVDRLLVAGSGVDAITARELALKVSEGPRLPASAHELETLLHGHLVAATRWTGLVVVLTDSPPAIAERARRLLGAARALSVPAGAIVSVGMDAAIDADETPAGRIVLPATGRVPALSGALLTSAIALQLLAERLARARGVNPDTLGREDPAQAAAHA